METVAIGIDLGKKTGLAVLKGKKRILTRPIHLEGEFGERYSQLYKEVRSVILRVEAMEYCIGMVGIEEPPYVKNAKVHGELCGYLAVIILLCEERMLPWIVINNKTIKLKLCGYGAASKQKMYETATEIIGIETLNVAMTQDEADAVLVARWVELFREENE